jgi:protein gp37
MSDKSAIEWTEATWNPVTGCSKVSPGCAHCYAERLSHRYGWTRQPWTPANEAENVVLHPERLAVPLHWRKPRMIFVNSMSDLFHEQVPDEFILQVFSVMAQAEQHTFQVLTKRPERMREWLLTHNGWVPQGLRPGWDGAFLMPLRNVWLGVSVENQHWANVRIPLLLETPAAVRFLSCEPLLGAVDLSHHLAGSGVFWNAPLQWVIVGGESGPKHRPMRVEWAQQLRDQCQAAGIAFFFKQHGGLRPKDGGRLLDDREWNEMPEGA